MTDFAIGVVSQGIQICSVIATYLGTLKGRDEDLAFIDRQAQGLESVFRSLQECLTQGSLDPSTSSAAAQVLSSMQACEAELNSLKQLAAHFSDNLSPNARPQHRIRQQVTKLKYPIQKPDICRVQRSLGVIKEILDLALQNLELSFSCLATNKLRSLEITSQQASNSLAALDSDISTLHLKLDDLLDRIQQDNTTVAAAIDEPDPRMAVYKLAYKPSNLATLCASLENHSENAMSTTNVLRKTSILKVGSCPCRRQLLHRRKRVSWLLWDFWDDEILRFEHYKGCKHFRSNGDERSRVRGLSFTGFINYAIIVTFYTSTGAGGQSLSANLGYHATVDRKTSPAFRVMSGLKECMRELLHSFQQIKHQAQWERLFLAASKKLESLFRLGKAGVKDVDSSNRSLLHAVAEVASYVGHLKPFFKSNVEAYSLPIAQLAAFLVKRQVSASLRDLRGDQAFIIAVRDEPFSVSLAEAFYPYDADIYYSSQYHVGYRLLPQELVQILKVYTALPRVAEVFHGPLSVAVLSNDKIEVSRLLRKHPKCLEEREGHSGQTPFHLAIGNPECLRILVERSKPRLLVQTDYGGYTILGYAILLSKTICDQRENQDESSCRCTLSLRILLEGDCPIIPYRDFKSGKDEKVIAYASKHCKIHLAKCLLQRRQRLKSIAQQCLSALEIDKFSLHRPAILDIYAMQVDEILRHRGFIEFGSLSTYLEDGTVAHSPVQHPRSIYHALSTTEDANIYFNLGFHDVTTPLDVHPRWFPSAYQTYDHTSLHFVKWLLDHDAPLREWILPYAPRASYVSDAFIIVFATHTDPYHACEHEGSEELVYELEKRMLLDNSLDCCQCHCSPGGCTPFVVRMHRLNLRGDELDIATTFTEYLNEYGNTLQWEHYYAAIRFTTFNTLGIAHTCMCREIFWLVSELDAEEIAEIQAEYAELLELLESLIQEFEAHAFGTLDADTNLLHSMITFWNGYWVRRMSEVLLELSQTGGANKAAAEDLGVIWDPQPENEIYEERKWKGWDHYIQRIEEIE
ncbi:hypothetical protein GGI35DRAFT_435211 [Trichoderma velutinum]